jgi:broad specificity phosphatase PhoE
MERHKQQTIRQAEQETGVSKISAVCDSSRSNSTIVHTPLVLLSTPASIDTHTEGKDASIADVHPEQNVLDVDINSRYLEPVESGTLPAGRVASEPIPQPKFQAQEQKVLQEASKPTVMDKKAKGTVSRLHRAATGQQTKPICGPRLSDDLLMAPAICRSTISMTYHLNSRGRNFANKVTQFVRHRLQHFMRDRLDPLKSNSDLLPESEQKQAAAALSAETLQEEQHLLPVAVFSSTHQRALETSQTLGASAILFETHACLNAQNMGVIFGMEFDEVLKRYGQQLADWSQNRFTYRFPAAQSHQDMAHAMEPLVLEMERQVLPVAVVTHSSTLQVLYGYFLGVSTTTNDYARIDVPEETVIELLPSQYGWEERRYQLDMAGDSVTTPKFIPISHKTSFYDDCEIKI